jgi:parvulin-like peptidyl-prolyl isomerase
MRKQLWIVSLAIALAACGGGDALSPAAATVSGARIPASELRETVDRCKKTDQFKQLAEQQGGPGKLARQFEQGFLAQLIRVEVVKAEAQERELEVSKKQIDDRVNQIRGQFPSEKEFQKAVKEQCLTFEQLEEIIEGQLLEQKLQTEVTAEVAPSEQEMRAYYQQNVGQFSTTEAQHILVDKQSLAARLSRQLKSASNKKVEPLFARLAKQYSKDKSNADRAGNLGVAGPGQFVPPFEEAMNSLDEGEVSGPVKTEFGYHVIRVINRDTKSFEEARPEIINQVSGSEQERVWQEFLQKTYKASDINVNPRYGKLDIETQRVVDEGAGDFPSTEDSPSPAESP